MSANADHGTVTAVTGRSVLDEHGLALGTITAVVADPSGRDYFVVDPGLFRAAHYVPVDGAFEANDGSIVVAWDRQWFKLSPKAHSRRPLSSTERRMLAIHYAHA